MSVQIPGLFLLQVTESELLLGVRTRMFYGMKSQAVAPVAAVIRDPNFNPQKSTTDGRSGRLPHRLAVLTRVRMPASMTDSDDVAWRDVPVISRNPPLLAESFRVS